MRAQATVLPPSPIDLLLERVSFETAAAPLLALLAGVLLTVSPISWPSIPAVMSVVTPAGRSGTPDGLVPEFGEVPEPLGRVRALLVVLGFVLGMDGVIATLGAVAVSLTVLLTRASEALYLVAGVLLAAAGLRLVTRRGSLCTRTLRLPPSPLRAVSAGTVFAVVGCPGCAPIAVGIGGAAAASGDPLLSAVTIGAFVLARGLTLWLTALAGGRLLGPTGSASWRRLDVIVGWLFLAGAAYYVLRVITGSVITAIPGTGGVLG